MRYLFLCCTVVEFWRWYYRVFFLESSLSRYLGRVYVLGLIGRLSTLLCTPKLRSLPHTLLGFFSGGLVVSSDLFLDLRRWLVSQALCSHQTVLFYKNSFVSAYSDSGIWDTVLLISFDRFFRSVLLFTLLPLTENNLVEKMSIKLFRELTQVGVSTTANRNFALSGVLRGVVFCLSSTFIAVVYVALLAL